MNATAACWLRGVVFTTVGAPLAGALVISIAGVAAESIESATVPGVLYVLAAFFALSALGVPFAAPVALVAGCVATAFAIRWARSGMDRHALRTRLGLLGIALGASGALLVGVALGPVGYRFGELVLVLGPSGIVVGAWIGLSFPRVLGRPGRRLAGWPD